MYAPSKEGNPMEYDYYPEEEQKKKGITVTKILKYVILAIVICVYVLILFRIVIKEDPKMAKEFVWTDEAVAAYNELGSDFKVMNQKIRSFNITIPGAEGESDVTEKIIYNEITKDGYFQANNFMYIEATKQLIITFRYNNASLKYLTEELELTLNNGEPYFLALSTSDGYITDYSYQSSSRFTYEYRRVVFEGVDLTDEKTVDLNIYCMGETVDLNNPINFITVYDSRIPVEYYNIKKALPAKADSDLTEAPFAKINE